MVYNIEKYCCLGLLFSKYVMYSDVLEVDFMDFGVF